MKNVISLTIWQVNLLSIACSKLVFSALEGLQSLPQTGGKKKRTSFSGDSLICKFKFV